MPVVRNPQFNFKEGFCWNNVLNPLARLLKAKMKTKAVNDVGSMSLSSVIQSVPNFYFVALLNSNLMFDYYREYINCTVNIQINDIKQLPIVIPSEQQCEYIRPLFQRAVLLKKDIVSSGESENYIQNELSKIELKIDNYVYELYHI